MHAGRLEKGRRELSIDVWDGDEPWRKFHDAPSVIHPPLREGERFQQQQLQQLFRFC